MDIQRIFELVSRATNISEERMKGKCRESKYVKARQVFCWLAAKYTKSTFVDIGKFLGGKHHTTIMYHVKEVNDKISIFDEDILHLLDITTELIKKDKNNVFIIEVVLPTVADIYSVEKYLKDKYIVYRIV